MEISYKKLEVWRLSVALIKEVYALSRLLPKSEEYILKQQLKRAVISVALNIAEGKSRRTAKDFSNFLNISSGSLSEVNAILNLCEELGYLINTADLYGKIEVLGMKINALRRSLGSK
jgi:four helix bundle protein